MPLLVAPDPMARQVNIVLWIRNRNAIYAKFLAILCISDFLQDDYYLRREHPFSLLYTLFISLVNLES